MKDECNKMSFLIGLTPLKEFSYFKDVLTQQNHACHQEIEETYLFVVGKSQKKNRTWRQKILTWKKMKRELEKKYLPHNNSQDVFLKFRNFRQKKHSMEEYTTELEL